ncbi:MAG: hypothetical protein AAB468_03040 [Patescibacteria group bacterium]
MQQYLLKLLPTIGSIDSEEIATHLWDIPQTIGELSYLTHDYFRYYGKFPSTVAAQLLEQFPAPKNGILLDNFAGSGTSLVEASLRSIRSVGIDINPLAVLSCKVKTSIYEINKLEKIFIKISNNFFTPDKKSLSRDLPDQVFLDKWFQENIVVDLGKLRDTILAIEETKEKDFFVLAFLAIIRRVSKAYDGEVRPHINKSKRQRNVFEAYAKKVKDMIRSQMEFNIAFASRKEGVAILTDSMTTYSHKLPKGNYWLVISHPPYLNCFDYLPVFNLELEWADSFKNLWDGNSKKELRKQELKSWPAKTEENVQNYYDSLEKAYRETYHLQPKGGRCAIVIGDCTIQGKLEKVHQKMIDVMKRIGYEISEINYRTTHYSTGKYSYQHKADYHKEQESKKDAILVFVKN